MIYQGRFEAKLDQKGRICLPAAFRSEGTEHSTSLVITNSQFQGRRCLDVYTDSAWQRLQERIQKMPQLKREVQAFQRFYLAGGQKVDPDSQSRMLVPQSLRRYAELDANLVLVGMGEKFEIWSEPTWSSLYDGLAENFEETLSVLASLEESES